MSQSGDVLCHHGRVIACLECAGELLDEAAEALSAPVEPTPEPPHPTPGTLAEAPMSPPAPRIWRDIAGAPKDGTYVLLWECDSVVPVIAHWVDFEAVGGAPEGYHSGWYDSMSGHYEVAPTHWMPLPAAPVRIDR